jgi:hypothetical protein
LRALPEEGPKSVANRIRLSETVIAVPFDLDLERGSE